MVSLSRARHLPYLLLGLVIFAGGVVEQSAAGNPVPKESKRWTEKFNISSCTWSNVGRNDYFVLEPGHRTVLAGHEGKEAIEVTITVLPETKKIGDVETRIIEERETHDGQIVEISRNYYARCQQTNDVFYFGEAVDMYKGGRITGHEGSWTADTTGVRAGLFMPATALIGARFYQEIAPGVAMDRVEIASDSESVKTPAGVFHDCVKTEETTPLEPGVRDYKVFARGVGLIQDGVCLLTKVGSTLNNKP
jgi:hypothetical protein